jgi:DNA-binding CsgD family transcriptional regulator
MVETVPRARDISRSHSRLHAALDCLRKVEVADGLAAAIDATRMAYQFTNVTFLVAQAGIPGLTTPRFLTTYPAEWTEIYFQRNYLDIDPVIDKARTALFPYDWSCLVDRRESARIFFNEAQSFGVGRHGLTIPVRAPNGERSLLSVTSDVPAREWRRLRDTCRDPLFLFAFNLHDRFVSLSGLRASNSPRPLSRRERQCLELLCKGLMFKQIAAHLMISESAVRLYIRSAKRKLSARTLSQATARAAALEIISM